METKTKKKIIIIEETEDDGLLKLTEKEFLKKLRDNVINTLNEFIIDDDLIFKYRNIIGFKDMLEYNISSNLFDLLIESGFIGLDDITNLNTTTYSNLTDEQVTMYSEHINWSKYILVLINKQEYDQSILYDISKNITDDRYWEILSTISLPIDFMKIYKNNIKWDIFYTTNIINNDIIKEFDDIFDVDPETSEPFLKSLNTNTNKNDKIEEQINSISNGLNISSDEIEEIINNNLNNDK